MVTSANLIFLGRESKNSFVILLKMKQIILASQSPRRKELLAQMGLTFDTVVSNFNEYLDDNRPVEKIAEELAVGKALEVAKQYPDALVIGSDVIVSVGKQQLAKAASRDEARAMLRLVTSQPNKVTCSVSIICISEHIQMVRHEESWVYFKPYDGNLVESYLDTGDWKDKAGSYGIQSGAAPLIDHISGNIDVIIGLPTHTLAAMLQELGVAASPVTMSSPVPITASSEPK
jgi:septum formation protein